MIDYASRLKEVTDSATFLAQLDIMDIEFASGHSMEVYVANTLEQKIRGLANLDSIDVDGMLFYYDRSTFAPYSAKEMRFDMDIAWFDRTGKLIDLQTHVAGNSAPIVTWKDFTYVIEAPAGNLPRSDIKVG